MNRDVVDPFSDTDCARLLAAMVNEYRETHWPPVAARLREHGESEPAIDALYLDQIELITNTFMQKIVELRNRHR
jgi:hypothetical protein